MIISTIVYIFVLFYSYTDSSQEKDSSIKNSRCENPKVAFIARSTHVKDLSFVHRGVDVSNILNQYFSFHVKKLVIILMYMYMLNDHVKIF